MNQLGNISYNTSSEGRNGDKIVQIGELVKETPLGFQNLRVTQQYYHLPIPISPAIWKKPLSFCIKEKRTKKTTKEEKK